jgi:SAM-dependent methyltransferase
VCDLGAGTGKFTRLLVGTGASVIAVEPVAEMRGHLEANVAGAKAVTGSAEEIPLPSDSVDAVTAAQSFHWFEPRGALAEIARVLKPDGGLGLLWNSRDDEVRWVGQLTKIIHWDEFMRGRYHDRDWAAVVAANGRFTPLEHVTFRYDQMLDVEGLVARVASVSYMATMDEEERAPILEQVRQLVAGFPPQFALPYVTHVWTCRSTE